MTSGAGKTLKDYRAFNILSIDSSGVNPAIIDKIQEQYPKFLRNTDLITSASIGALQACGLASGKSLESLCDMPKEGSLRPFLESHFGDTKLKSFNKRVVIVTKGRLLCRGWEIFHNFSEESDGEIVVDIILNTMRPPVRNPCMIGAAQALASGALFGQIRLLSLGYNTSTNFETADFESRMFFKNKYHRIELDDDDQDEFDSEAALKWLEEYWI